MAASSDGPGEHESISVVYPTLDRPEMLMRSLGALLNNSVPPDEVVIVDQSRGDGTARALEDLGSPLVKHVPSKKRGLSNARNTGIEASSHPILGFIDDDCIPARNWVEAARHAIERDHESSVWIGQDYPEAEAISDEVVASLQETTYSKNRKADPWSIGPTGGDSFFRRSVFEQVGPFDPRLGQGSAYPGAEDGDMIYRVLKAGLRVTYTNTIRVHHVEWRSDSQTIDNSYNYGFGVGAMLAKYYVRGDYFPLTRIFTRRFLSKYIAVPVWLLLGQMNRYRNNLKWCQSIITGFRRWRQEETPDDCLDGIGKG